MLAASTASPAPRGRWVFVAASYTTGGYEVILVPVRDELSRCYFKEPGRIGQKLIAMDTNALHINSNAVLYSKTVGTKCWDARTSCRKTAYLVPRDRTIEQIIFVTRFRCTR